MMTDEVLERESRQLREGLTALANGMDTLADRMTALECEMRDLKAYVLTKLPEQAQKRGGDANVSHAINA